MTLGRPAADPAFVQDVPEFVVWKTPASVPTHQVVVGLMMSSAIALRETSGRPELPLADTLVKTGVARAVLVDRQMWPWPVPVPPRPTRMSFEFVGLTLMLLMLLLGRAVAPAFN